MSHYGGMNKTSTPRVTLVVRDRYGIKKVGTYTGATAEEAWDAFRDAHGEYRIIGVDRLTFPRMRSVEYRFALVESEG